VKRKEPEKRHEAEPDETPLPAPMPHHVADPTSSQERPSAAEITDVDRDLPLARFEDLANELETRKRPRIESEQIRRVTFALPTVPVEKVDESAGPISRDSEDELTRPRARVDLADPTEPVDALEQATDHENE
jgi:hypothetical protein